MTDASTLEDTRYITDAEVVRRLGLPEKKGRLLLRYLDEHPKLRFPPRDKLFGDRRFWPAVKAYLDERNRLMIETSATQRGRP